MVLRDEYAQSKIEAAGQESGGGKGMEFITRFDLTPCMRFSDRGYI